MLVHVPLLVRYPPLVKAGKYSEGTELVDVVPAVADALGVPLDAEWQGESLIPLTQGIGTGYPRMSMTSMYEDAHGARIGKWKVRVSGGGATRVFDMVADYDEKHELTEATIGARLVLDPLWLFRTFNLEWKKSQWGNAANVTARFAQDLGE
jgi:arylsulfatase A-like enzyme